MSGGGEINSEDEGIMNGRQAGREIERVDSGGFMKI